MRALFWLLTLTALAIGVALLGRLTDGYVLWVMPPWRAEISLNLFVLLQLATLLVAYLLLRAVVNTLSMPRVVSAFRARRARQRAERAATDALRLLWEGRYGHAIKSAEKVGAGGTVTGTVAGTVDNALVNMVALLGLKAAHALHDPARIAAWQARARAADAAATTGAGTSDWHTARLMTEAGLALDARDYAAAEAALAQLAPQERRQISAQRLALRLAQARSDWAGMLRITRLLEKHRALSAEQALPLRLRAHRGMIDNVRDEPAQLMRYWRGMSAVDQADLPLAQRATRALIASGACAESAQLIEDYLDEHWESALLADYANCPSSDLLGRIAHCEKWLHAHPHDGPLLLALGRLCVQRQLWGKAQSYLEASLAVAKSCATHIELAQLFDRLERTDEANRHFRAAAVCQEKTVQMPFEPRRA